MARTDDRPLPSTTRPRLAVWLVLAALLGCEGSADIALSSRLPARPSTEQPPDGTGPQAPPATPTGTVAPPPCVPGTVDVAVTPLRRLTRREYTHTLEDVLGERQGPAATFLADEKVSGFDSNAIAPLTPLQLGDYVDAAEAVAARAVTRLASSGGLSCDWSAESCVLPWLTRTATRLYRRPAPPEAMERLLALYRSAKATWGAPDAVRLVLEALLTSPYFLYHHEPASPAGATPGELVPLDGHSVAARLSYFFWQSAPDDALFEAAAKGELTTPEALEAQARRLLADPRAERALESFHGQWLELDLLEELSKAPELHPNWDAALAGALRAQTGALVRSVFRSEGARLTALLTTREGYLDAATASLYGVPAPSGATGPTRVTLPPERRGLLTQPSFLAAHAHAAEPSWVLRGRFVREQLLCGVIPPPPPSVDMDTANDPNRLTNPTCKGCHTLMDPIGQGFDAFDAVGRFVDSPAVGEVVAADPSVEGSFTGVAALAEKLAQSPTVQHCLTRQWFRFALGREETREDACSLEAGSAALAGSGGDLRELLVGLARSDAFRFRRTSP